MPHGKRQLAGGEEERVGNVVKQLLAAFDRRNARWRNEEHRLARVIIERRRGVHPVRFAQAEHAQRPFGVLKG